jgi:lipid II:glycine glycyltransferase (peptidoglycan interpeptide bridge formation enzyme)
VIRLRRATDADDATWDAARGSTAAGDFLHDRAWAPVAAFDGQPQRRFVVEDDASPVGLVAAQERRLLGRRAFWYVPHGPVLDYAAPEAAARLRGILVGLRHTRIVELADDDALLAGFDKDTRYSVRRAEREGVEVTTVEDGADVRAIDALHDLVAETQRRAGFPLPPLERYRVAWRSLAAAGRATILEARREGELLASALLVIEGDRSFYLFSGSRREERGEPKRYASYALQWAMMRLARDRGVRSHDLWGIAPPTAGADHPWHGVGLFKKGFGGREVTWAGSWDLVVDPTVYRLRRAAGIARGWLRPLRR